MLKLYTPVYLLAILFCFNRANAQCGTGRYHDQIFSTSSTTVAYGNAIEYDGKDTTLLVDIYQPTGDTLAARPLMIYAFGGSFTSGIRQSPDLESDIPGVLVGFCPYFSKMGYVTASIDYRLGVPDGSDSSEFMAVMRGVQDMKAAVRFFYKDAQTVNKYRIDTNQIFIGGVSAGAFIGLNYAYLKQDTLSKPRPSFAVPAIVALGGIDGNSGNPGYSQKVKGVIDLCGGIADTVWIMPGDPILVGVHGTNDSLVTCYFDSAYASTHTRASLFGGGDIKNRMSHITFTDSFYLFQGQGHVPFILNPQPLKTGAYMDTTESIIRDFLYQHLDCVSGIDAVSDNLSVSVYPNPSNDALTIRSSEPKDLYVSVITMLGQVVQRHILPANAELTLHRDDFGAGVYLLQFSQKGSANGLKTMRVVFY